MALSLLGDITTHHDLPAFRLRYIASKLLHLNQWKKNSINLEGILAGPRLLHPSLPYFQVAVGGLITDGHSLFYSFISAWDDLKVVLGDEKDLACLH